MLYLINILAGHTFTLYISSYSHGGMAPHFKQYLGLCSLWGVSPGKPGASKEKNVQPAHYLTNK